MAVRTNSTFSATIPRITLTATLMSYREDGRCIAGCEGEIGRYRRARSSGRSDHRAPHSRQMTRRGEETCEMLRKDWQTGQQGVGMSGTSSSASGLLS
jgi:hypothetical protein